MKIRVGFVSNSSTTAFCIGKNYMTEEQIKLFSEFLKKELEDYDENDDYRYAVEERYVREGEYYFLGEVSQHDGEIFDFLDNLGVGKYVESFSC